MHAYARYCFGKVETKQLHRGAGPSRDLRTGGKAKTSSETHPPVFIEMNMDGLTIHKWTLENIGNRNHYMGFLLEQNSRSLAVYLARTGDEQWHFRLAPIPRHLAMPPTHCAA